MNQLLNTIYYLPNAFLFYETTAEDNDKLLDNNLESNNIIQEQKIAEKKPQLTTKNINKILIKNTERIILWNGFNLTWWNHLTLYKRLKEIRKKEKNMKDLKYEKSNYIFEFLSSFFSISYINRTKGRFGLYWKVDLFDNYAGFHNFNNKCTRGLLGLYIGVYHNYFINKNIQIGYHIGIGMCIQRYYSLCFGNRLIGGLDTKKNIKNKYYSKKATEKEEQEIGKDMYKDAVLSGKTIYPTSNTKFYLSEILMNPFSYYNADLIVDLGVLNIVHKSGFVFNINWKVGIVNTVLILKSNSSFNEKKDKKSSFNEKIMLLLYNVSIGFGYDLNKAIEKIEKD